MCAPWDQTWRTYVCWGPRARPHWEADLGTPFLESCLFPFRLEMTSQLSLCKPQRKHVTTIGTGGLLFQFFQFVLCAMHVALDHVHDVSLQDVCRVEGWGCCKYFPARHPGCSEYCKWRCNPRQIHTCQNANCVEHGIGKGRKEKWRKWGMQNNCHTNAASGMRNKH